MYERKAGFQSGLLLSKLQPSKEIFMQSQVKNAVITTGIVLGTIYLLNMFAPTRNIVQKALA
jgi:hypothetical protein